MFLLIFNVKNLTNFRKTAETGVYPRLDIVLQARDNRERNCSGAVVARTVATPCWSLCGGERGSQIKLTQ